MMVRISDVQAVRCDGKFLWTYLRNDQAPSFEVDGISHGQRLIRRFREAALNGQVWFDFDFAARIQANA